MIISRDPASDKRKEMERQLSRPEDERKEELLNELRKESLSVIVLAFMYAKNFEETGEDVTRRLITANQNVQTLEAAYRKGVDDTLARIRREQKNER